MRKVSGYRVGSEEVLARAEWLDADEAGVLRQVLGQGVLPRDVAAVAGRPTRAIQRLVRSLIFRLSDPEVVCALRHQNDWPPDVARVALYLFVRNRTMKKTAEALNLTFHEVRQHAQAAKALITAELSHAVPRRSHDRP